MVDNYNTILYIYNFSCILGSLLNIINQLGYYVIMTIINGRNALRCSKRSAIKTKKNSFSCKSNSSSASRTKSQQAKSQRRNDDGTFAKGFIKPKTPKRAHSRQNVKNTTTCPTKSSAKKMAHKNVESHTSSSRIRNKPSTKGSTKRYFAEKAIKFDCTNEFPI